MPNLTAMGGRFPGRSPGPGRFLPSLPMTNASNNLSAIRSERRAPCRTLTIKQSPLTVNAGRVNLFAGEVEKKSG